MKELIGKKILSVAIDKEEQQYLLFRTDQGPVCYETEGDCCSHSWFADITGFGALVGHTVRDVAEVEMPDEWKGDEKLIRMYGYKLTTTGGYADIVFRNSSNGYYGGWLNLLGETPPRVAFADLTDDYGA